ncbi:MAG TPA: hypothetical protein VEW69_03940, partial [Alphaproteobacteria bacterium]|nr:hypothetical protein [Alphaproteobacteria bacterium]
MTFKIAKSKITTPKNILPNKLARRLLCLAALMTFAAICASAQTTDPNFVVHCVADPEKVDKALKEAAASHKPPEITGDKVCAASQMAKTGAKDTEYTFNSLITLVVEHADEQSFD